ncbi:hypothetical protein DN619_34335 [Klebsiella michiganensis]|nr:hypothetical protein DN619_34335 [Klebsiella michiganensis]
MMVVQQWKLRQGLDALPLQTNYQHNGIITNIQLITMFQEVRLWYFQRTVFLVHIEVQTLYQQLVCFLDIQ